jgi:hypothetical protein
MTKIQDWSITVKSDGYTAPELISPRLVGIVFGHPVKKDGEKVMSGPIIKVEGRIVTTHSGTVYHLGRIDPGYRKWLKENGIPYDPKHPIVVRGPGEKLQWQKANQSKGGFFDPARIKKEKP